jgi:hypothetical protein
MSLPSLPGSQGIQWTIFAQPFDAATTQKMVAQKIPWLIDLLLVAITGVALHSLPAAPGQFWLEYHSRWNFRNKTWQDPFPRRVQLENEVKPQNRIHLLQLQDGECAVLWLDLTHVGNKNSPTYGTFEIFYPFPAHFEARKNELIAAAQKIRGFVEANPHEKLAFYNVATIVPTNLWLPYFCLLRLFHGFDQVQRLFMDINPDNVLRFQTNALTTFRSLGYMVGNCLWQAADKDNEMAKNIASLYFGYGRQGNVEHVAPLDLHDNENAMDQIARVLYACHVPKNLLDFIDVVAMKHLGGLPQEPTGPLDPKWLPFSPMPDAIEPRYYFSK